MGSRSFSGTIDFIAFSEINLRSLSYLGFSVRRNDCSCSPSMSTILVGAALTSPTELWKTSCSACVLYLPALFTYWRRRMLSTTSLAWSYDTPCPADQFDLLFIARSQTSDYLPQCYGRE